MAPAKPPNDDKDKQPATPRRASAANNKTSPKRSGNNGVTPANRKSENAQNQKTAPAAAAGATGGVRKTSSPKKPTLEPTLLGDFFLGRPSPARKAAAQRRKSVDNTPVRQELRQQMREAAVRRVQQPGKVQSRVKDWQKTNAAAMAIGNPEATPSEPTEVAVHVDEESVTEEDRVRIKTRDKGRRRSSAAKKEEKPKETTPQSRMNAPPKKRVVSDDNWMKRNQANAAAKPAPKKTPLFQKPSKPGTMQDKVKAWATQVEIPEAPAPPKIPKNPRPAREYATKCGATITVEEDHAKASTVHSSASRDVITVEEEAESNLSSSKTWKTESGRSGDDGIRVRAGPRDSPHTSGDERLRLKPTRNKEGVPMGDGIRIRPIKTSPLPDDGIRVRPIKDATPRPSARQLSPRRVSSGRRDRTPTGRAPASETETDIHSPNARSKPRMSPKRMRRATAPAPTITETSITVSDDEQSWTSDYDSEADTDRPSSAPAKSLAEVPFGDSAFSELDLPVGADHHHFKRPKPQRNTSSFGAVPKAFKKIMTGAKEIVQVAAEPPKPVANQPPSIEKWLNGTVDPFVEQPPAQRNSLEKDWKQDVRRRSSAEKPLSIPTAPLPQAQDEIPRRGEEQQGVEPDVKQPVGLKRSKATRAATSPQKQPTVKIPLRETLNNLFRGESTGHKVIPKAYSSYQDTELTLESESDFTDLNSYMEHVDKNGTGDHVRNDSSDHVWNGTGDHVRSINPSGYSPPSPESSYVSTDVSGNTEGPYMTPALPRRRPPPTNGQYELSTIASEGSDSVVGSDTMSILSDSTVTQTTALTRSTAISRRNRGSGSKRRFTKHSDLVSVLSLPDDEGGLARASSIKSTSSLRRRTSNLEKVTVDDLLQEFAIDEDLYRRELKTLVDGAVPVLLRQVVESKEDYASDLFGPDSAERADTMGKAVVNMGIALERLRNLHKRSPTNDVNKILTWVLAAYPVYDKYLDVWRLGFEGIVVNLAPIPTKPDDMDSLVNAMPRNEYGDVVDAKGQPVDLQRLLTRPLARIRGLLKLLRGARAIGVKHPELEIVIEDFTELQEKVRRRHREETARKIDEDAINTDTSRCCDLRMLRVIEGVLIDPSRQVNAKDFFSLDLSHSSGQRLECQIELIFRDKPKDPMDRGDILVRDTGHARYCLLFPPVPKSAISARRGDLPGALVVMIRGRHNGNEWYELLTLTTDLDEQVLDWLDILGTSPVPPATAYRPANDLAPSPLPKVEVKVPLGERTERARLRKSRADLAPSRTVSAAEEKHKASPPTRYHVRHASTPPEPTTPPGESNARYTSSPERTPTQKSFERTRPSSLPTMPPMPETTPLREDMRPDPKKLTKSPPNSKPFRDDGAPRPPVHRTLSSGKPGTISPPVELAPAARIRRRGSSPLKHEFRPSDVASDSSGSDSESISDYESSSDELDEADVPDTQPAISIKQTSDGPMSAIGSVVGSGVESVVSDNSIAPSQSASQVGLYGQLGPGTAPSPEYVIKSIATISYWSNKKGQWGEAWHEACSIVVTPGLVEAYPLSAHAAPVEGALNSSGSSEFGGDGDLSRMQPLLALELTPVVMIRQSTVVDLEIRSPVRPYCKLATIDGKIFRFRAPSAAEGTTLYMAVHKARLNNAKYKALEEEARFRSFGQPQPVSQDADGQTSSSNRRSWFGRKNSYRASTRAPSQSASQSQGTSSSMSAPSLLKRLTGGGSAAFNIDKSSVDRRSMHSRPTTAMGSLYTSGSSSSGNATPPRSPSISTAENSGHTVVLGSDNLKVRCHLLVSSTKWEDHGNCTLQITRPPPGMRQELRIRHGMEKRVIVTKIPKRSLFGGEDKSAPLIVLDVVLGSKCFGRLGTRGIVLNVWEDLRDEMNNVGLAPKSGGLSGTVKKWCFQCGSAAEANWIFGLVAQEVNIGL